MQNSVVFGILLDLLNNKILSRVFLSEKYEISSRTVARYVDALSSCGVPIVVVRGQHGGYTLSEDFALERAFLTASEKSLLIAHLKTLDNSELSHIADKVEYLANQEKEQFFFSSENLIIDAGPWNKPNAYRNKMAILNEAIKKNVSVTLCYVDRYDIETRRLFDPYSIVFKAGLWYTYGYCNDRNDFRLFKLSRIKSINSTEQKFPQRSSDLHKKLSEHIADGEEVDLKFEFSNIILGEIEEWLGRESITDNGLQYVAKVRIFGGNQLIAKLLSFGSSIKVLAPLSVKDAILSECRQILKEST